MDAGDIEGFVDEMTVFQERDENGRDLVRSQLVVIRYVIRLFPFFPFSSSPLCEVICCWLLLLFNLPQIAW